MEINISEEKQRELFLQSWQERDVQLVCEVPVFCRSVDLVKYDKKQNTVTAIEFKTKNWKRAVEQVVSTAISFDFIEICIRKPKTQKAQENVAYNCSIMGIGVYFFDIDNMEFEHFVLPQKVEKIWKVQKTQVIEFIEKGEMVCQMM